MTSLDMEGDASGKKGLPELLELIDLLFVNAAAAMSIDSDPWKAIRHFHALGVATVILTRGAQGCLLSDRSGHEYVIAGHKVETKDTTGAGDCFAGAFAFGRIRGLSDLESAELANLMAAMSTTAFGSRGALLSASKLSQLAREKGYAWWRRLI